MDKVDGDRGTLEPENKTIAEDGGVKDDFSTTFDEASLADEKTDLKEAVDELEDDAAKKEAGAQKKDASASSEESKASESKSEKPNDSVNEPGEGDDKDGHRYKTLQGVHKKDKEKWEREKQDLLSQLEEARKPKPEEKKETVDPKKVVKEFAASLTEEEEAQLKDYEEDFATVSKMEGIKRSRELKALREEMSTWFADTKKEIEARLAAQSEQLAPIVTSAEKADLEDHFDLIRSGYELEDGTKVSGHPDFEKYRDDGSIMAWVESNPGYLQEKYKEVLEKGNAIDIIDLLSRFKKENNITTPNPSENADNVVSINKKKAEKKKAITEVVSRTGAVSVGTALKDDYDGAFDEASQR